ncbi:hypothetical protein T484DRAFT_3007400 [Baffinella frigidus]|nr:hypothetical protein T484DRAFT_3007400 [Cryptophyta sp. CCMP2293]
MPWRGRSRPNPRAPACSPPLSLQPQPHTSGSGCRVQDFGFRVQGFSFRLSSLS